MINLIWGLIFLVLVIYNFLREMQNKSERQKLLDRIMARSYEEFKNLDQPTTPPVPDIPPDLVPISEASDEEFNKAINKELGKTPSVLQQAKEALRKVKYAGTK